MRCLVLLLCIGVDNSPLLFKCFLCTFFGFPSMLHTLRVLICLISPFLWPLISILSVLEGHGKCPSALQPTGHSLGKGRDLCKHISVCILSLWILGSWSPHSLSSFPVPPNDGGRSGDGEGRGGEAQHRRDRILRHCLNILECSLTNRDGGHQSLHVAS